MKMFATAVNNQEHLNQSSNYYSVEFALDAPHPVYQFKLRRSDQNVLFFLVKKNSAVLSRLKVGRVMPMKYYSGESFHLAEVHETQIHEIVNETQGRFRGHCRIQLELVEPPNSGLLQ